MEVSADDTRTLMGWVALAVGRVHDCREFEKVLSDDIRMEGRPLNQ